MTAANREAVLAAALAAVNGERNESYDEPENNFLRISMLWTAYLGYEVSASDVAVMNILQKVGRLMYSPTHWDSWVDIAGYAACGADVADSTDLEQAPAWDTPLGRITSLDDDGNGVRMTFEVYPEWEWVIKQRTEGTL